MLSAAPTKAGFVVDWKYIDSVAGFRKLAARSPLLCRLPHGVRGGSRQPVFNRYMSTRLHALHAAGQSLWLDFIDRTMLFNGDLKRRIAEDELTGITSNPSIFEKALAEGSAYDAQLGKLDPSLSERDVFFELATTDVRNACDALRSVYDASKGADGFVSMEVTPELAHDADGSVEQARWLHELIDRPNLMIKIPGTVEGATAVRALIAAGVNVNITLLFSIEAHARVIEAYIAGLEDRVAAGLAIDKVASVASFFVSRVDTAVDRKLGQLAAETSDPARIAALNAMLGRIAIANAKMAYRLFQASFSGARWDALAKLGARVQRPLWASTSTKNPAYRDVVYVEELVGPDTVNTLPPATIEAFRDHGEVRQSITENVGEAERVLAALEASGISLEVVTDSLLAEGLVAFERAMATLQDGLAKKRADIVGGGH